LIAAIVAVLALMPAAVAGLNLDSEMSKVAAMTFHPGDTATGILDQLAPSGNLDSSVSPPKKTFTAQDGSMVTVFVFDIGTNESDFTELLKYFNDDGFKTLQDKTQSGVRGVELYDGETQILFLKKGNVLVEYRSKATFSSAKAGAAAGAGSGDWLWVLLIVVLAAVFALVGVLVYFLTRKKPAPAAPKPKKKRSQ
jgi:hypothetical protein